MGTVTEKKQKNFIQRMGLVRVIIFIVFLGVFLVSAGMLTKDYLEGKEAQDDFTQLVVQGDYDLKALHQQNPDIVGWLQIPDTRVNYPVMQTKSNNEYYLRRNFQKEYSIAGTPFMEAKSDMALPTLNWMIYGHNMKNGNMFHDLLKYEDEEFYQSHKTLTFDTLEDEGTYEVVAAYYTQIYSSEYEGFRYYRYYGITSKSQLDEFIAGSKALTPYDIDVEVNGDRQVITLSTCAYQVEDGRFVVVAQKME